MFRNYSESYEQIREAVERLCDDFPGEYWRLQDQEASYPSEFVQPFISPVAMEQLVMHKCIRWEHCSDMAQ